MLLAIGTKVKLKHTGDHGEVVELLPNGMVNVYLIKDDMEIPVFEDDLIPSDLVNKPVAKRIIVPEKKPIISNATPPSQEAESQYAILKSVGLQLVFEPVLNAESITEYYRIWLINDSKDEFIVTMALKIKGEVEKEHNSKIKGMSKNDFGTLLFDKLNDNPVFELQKWRITSKGTEGFAKNSIKLKAKTFFSKMKTAPFLNKPVHWFLAFDAAPKKKDSSVEDLRSYTKRNASRRLPRNEEERKRFSLYDVEEFASFEIEVDLHTEHLGVSTAGMDNAQILRLQLSHFEAFIENALRIGVPRVFIIHGVGKGKLRDMIATKLIQNRDVKTFRNEYHPRYGWGATEVEF
jgi:DNA-nicking Smr family endonuclease